MRGAVFTYLYNSIPICQFLIYNRYFTAILEMDEFLENRYFTREFEFVDFKITVKPCNPGFTDIQAFLNIFFKKKKVITWIFLSS